jgi:hypothetical protein
MQSFMKLISLSLLAIFIVSCGAGKKEKDSVLGEKKEKLEKLKKTTGGNQRGD